MKVLQKDNINFFAALSEEKHASKGTNKVLIGVCAAFLLTTLVFSGAGIMLYKSSLETEQTIKIVQAYMDENNSEYEQKSKTQASLQAYMNYNKACSDYINQLKSLKRIGSVQFSKIDTQLPSDTKIEGYKFSNNCIEISCSAGNENAPAAFAKSLADSKQFANVEYMGFDSSDNVDGNKNYTFNIICTLLE